MALWNGNGNGNGRSARERLRDADLPAAWLTRIVLVIGTAAISLFSYLANDKLSALSDLTKQVQSIDNKEQWLIGTVSGVQKQVNDTQDQVRQITNTLLGNNRR